jgi:hypothetical protein
MGPSEFVLTKFDCTVKMYSIPYKRLGATFPFIENNSRNIEIVKKRITVISWSEWSMCL